MLATLLEAGAPSPGVDLSLGLGPYRARLALCGHTVAEVFCGPFVGEDALFRLLLLPPRAVTQRARLSLADGPVLGDVEVLLQRFVAFEGGLERDALDLGGLDRVWRIQFVALKAILPGLPEDVKRVIRLCDGTRDVRRLCAEGPLAPLLTLRVLDKLRVAGVLVCADSIDDNVDVGEANEDGIAADRRWLEARAARTTTTPATSTASVQATAVPAPTKTTATPTAEAESVVVLTTKTARTAVELEMVARARQRATPASIISGETALPRPTPRPSEDLHAWLGEEAGFFADEIAAGPKHAPWSLWQLALLLVGGGLVGGLIAWACG